MVKVDQSAPALAPIITRGGQQMTDHQLTVFTYTSDDEDE